MLPTTFTLNKPEMHDLPADPQAKITAAIAAGMLDCQLRVRDMNAYRTSYGDMTRGLETHVKSNMPAGYGGHVPTTRHDVLHRNTQFDERLTQLETDPNRDTFGGFTANLTGVPYLTRNPRVPGTNPTAGCFPEGLVVPPWAILQPQRPPLNYRNAEKLTEKTLKRFANGADPSTA
ncbi:hypothetical protein CSUI_005938 [Cystoisospora suis]|uniref:Uncharacterized protein n=1 Tax=Cystoisospora suis TaxID=483139 RepID=A0A2C6KIA5_9APIC|nr:hypothetical protein CSUI_005938 [Cystoisospora suis]